MSGPAAGMPLMDAQGRAISYLRLSVTDRCNFRCHYCSPASWPNRTDLLTAPELVRICRLFTGMGVTRVRLTGGEPLIRPDILEICSAISEIREVAKLAITTNASRLSPLAKGLADAGVDQLNISLDTLSPQTFARISSVGSLDSVLGGIESALEAGFARVRINVVVVKGVNDEEVVQIVRYCHERRLTPRFIELMPFGSGEGVPSEILIDRLAAAGILLTPEVPSLPEACGPARYYRSDTGDVGFISPMSQSFCGDCNRVRVAANGDLRPCLGGRVKAPLQKLIRRGASDQELAVAIREALGQKPQGHRFHLAEGHSGLVSMVGLGG